MCGRRGGRGRASHVTHAVTCVGPPNEGPTIGNTGANEGVERGTDGNNAATQRVGGGARFDSRSD
eukprot:2758259-Alexandrium_andersonii.AAC.1